MRKILLGIFIVIAQGACSQSDPAKWIRAFPITGYVVDLNDSIKIVQVYFPDAPLIKEKQVGLLHGIYKDDKSDTMTIGTGRCNLIKGDYYYFSINIKESGRMPKENDLLYILVDKPVTYYGQVLRLASHFIVLQNVYEKDMYDRYAVFAKWNKPDEEALLDSSVSDIHFTGRHFLENNPSMNTIIKGGKYDGKMVLNTMLICNKQDVMDFLDYIIARPRLYAGHRWKISEVFATWLINGSPTVIRN